MKKAQEIDNSPVYDFKQLVARYKKFGDKIVFKYKKQGEIIEIPYKKYAEDIEALRRSTFKYGSRKSSINWK